MTAADLEKNILRDEIERLTKELFKAKSRYSREWVGLTDEEIQAVHDSYHKRMGPMEFARAIEAKVKELNT